MDRTIEILTCDTVGSLPSIPQLLTIPRDKTLRVIFSPSILPVREEVGAEWKEKLPGFSVGVHGIRPEINVSKLITEEEIIAHATFFEQCAKEYRKLAMQLINALAAHFKETIDPENAMHTFGKYKRDRQTGMMEGWKYYLHGAHCGFKSSKTGQAIEVYLITSLEFGVLDPFFFVEFIKTTGSYQPLPVAIFEDYLDGDRILEKMVAVGKLEKIQSLIDGHDLIVVRDRAGE
jgi:hypothetical protein